MQLKLLDWQGNPHTYDIGNQEDIWKIRIAVFSGDEIALVDYKDGRELILDTAPGLREIWYFDNWYTIYNPLSFLPNLIFNEKWVNRKTSSIGLNEGFANEQSID